MQGKEEVDESDLVPQVIDDLVAGYEGSMTFTTAEPPPATYVSKKKLEEFEQRQRAQALLAVKNCAGRRTMDADSTFEMGLGDALMHLVSGKRR